eukprot:gene2635-3273_t
MDKINYEHINNNLEQIPNLLKSLWKPKEGLTYYKDFLDVCMKLITGNTNTEEFFKDLADKKLLNFGACETTWSFGDTAYKCKTCQLDPTSALCISCFKAADHEGHDYALQSVGGGFCDCGDPTAFRPSGFCTKHKEQITDISKYPQRFLVAMSYVLQFLLERIYETFIGNKLDEYEQMMEWLLKLAQRGDIVKVVIIKYISNTDIGNTHLLPPSPFSTPLIQLFYVPTPETNKVAKSMKATISNFLVFLRGSIEFIESFIRIILPIYKKCILDTKKHILLSTYSIFSSRAMSDLLVSENAAEIVMSTINDYYQRYLIQRQSFFKRNRPERITDSYSYPQYSTIAYLGSVPPAGNTLRTDIGFILSNPDVATSVLASQHLLAHWFNMIGLSQGMNPNVTFMPTMAEDWVPSFHLDISFTSTLFSIVNSIPINSDSLNKMLFLSTQYLGKWILGWLEFKNNYLIEKQKQKELEKEKEKDASTTTTTTSTTTTSTTNQILSNNFLNNIKILLDSRVSREGFSFHLPLHRSVSSILYRIISNLGEEYQKQGGLSAMFSKIIGENPLISIQDYAKASTYHPHRLLAALGEIKSGMWKANGREEDMFLQAVMYQSLHYQKFYDLDIFLIQIGSIIMGSNQFVVQSTHLYNLYDYFKLELNNNNNNNNNNNSNSKTVPPTPSKELRKSSGTVKQVVEETTTSTTTDSTTTKKNEEEEEKEKKEKKEKQKQEDDLNKKKSLSEDFIHSLVMLSTNKMLCGMTDEQVIRKEIIHRLCLGDATHSQLVRAIQKKFVTHPKFDSILKEVSIFQNPQKTEQGKYQLRESFWSEFDPYFSHYNTQDLQAAEERYTEFVNKTKSKIARGTFIQYPTLPCLEDLNTMLCSRSLHQILFTLLQNQMVNSPKSTETLFTHTLNALELCINQTLQSPQFKKEKEQQEPGPISTPVKAKNLSNSGTSKKDFGPPVENFYDIDFPSLSNIFVNSTFEVVVSEQKKMSLIIMLVKLTTQQINAEHKQQIQNIINTLMENSSQCKLVVESYWAAIKAKKQPQSARKEDPEEERKRMAKARQAAILAQMKTQQQAFNFDEEDEDDYEDEYTKKKEEAKDTNAFIVDGELSTHTCALCREAGSLQRPMGRVTFIQPSSILMLSKLTPEERKKRIIDSMKKDMVDPSKLTSSDDSKPEDGQVQEMALQPGSIHNAFNDILGQNEMDDEDLDDVEMGSDDEEDSEDEVAKAISFLNKISHSSELIDNFGFDDDMDMQLDEEDGNEDEDIDFDNDFHRSNRYAQTNNNAIEEIDEDEEDEDDFVEGSGGYFDDFDDDIISKFEDKIEPICGNPWSNKFSRQEIFRNTEQSVNLHMSFCGHQIHEDCFNNYSWSLVKNNNYEGEELVDPQKGEFLCVLCRRIGNGIVPVIPDSGFTNNESNINVNSMTKEIYTQFVNDLKVQLTAPQPTPEQLGERITDPMKKVKPAIEQFASRIYSLKYQLNFYDSESGPKVFPFICSSIASTIADAELAIRVVEDDGSSSDPNQYSLFKMTDSNRVDIRSLFRVCVAHAATNPPPSYQSALLLNSIFGCTALPMEEKEVDTKEKESTTTTSKSTTNTTDSSTTNNNSKESSKSTTVIDTETENTTSFPPLLSLDLFHSFVQVYLRYSNSDMKINNQKFYFVARLFYDACITQAVFYHFKPIEESSNNTSKDQFIEQVNKLITNSYENISPIQSVPAEHVEAIKSYCLVFLRKMALFLYSCLKINPISTRINNTTGSTPLSAEIDYLLTFLQLPSFESQLLSILNTLISHDDASVPLVSAWSEQLLSSYAITSSSLTSTTSTDDNNNNQQQELSILPSPTIPQPFILIKLPELYNSLSQHYSTIPCMQCKTISNTQALCLICGTLCCMGGCCKRFFDQKSECILHAEKCNAGTCIFLVIKSSSTLLIHIPRKTLWISPYLDDHGEEDPNLRRGRPLYLNTSRYNQLNSLLIKHQIDQDSKIAEHTSRERF